MKKRLLLCCFWVLGGSYLLGQQGLQVGLRGTVHWEQIQGDWPNNLQVQSQRQTGGGVGIDLAYFFTPTLGIASGVGFHAGGGSISLQNAAIIGPNQIDASNSPYYLQNSNQALSYIRTDTVNSQSEQLTIGQLEIPLLLRFRTRFFYAEAGPVIGFPLRASYEGQGSVSYAGTFTELGTTVYNTGFGFQNYGINGSGDFAVRSPQLNVWASVGTSLSLGEKTELRAGVGYRLPLTGILAANAGATDFFSRQEGDNAYYSLAETATSMQTSGFSAQVGIYQTLGGGGSRPAPKPKSKKENCAPNQMVSLPLSLSQPESSRRIPAQVDTDLIQLAQQELPLLKFKGADLAENGRNLRVCLGKTDPENIEARFKKENLFLRLLDAQPDQGLYELTFEPLTQTEPITMIFRDESGKSVNQVQVSLSLNGELIYEKKINSGEPFTYLYEHPKLNYRLSASAPCFETQEKELTIATDLNQPVRMDLTSLGTSMQTRFPAQLTNFSPGQPIPLNGMVNVPGAEFPIQGEILPTGQIALSGNCAPDEVRSYQLSLQKPIGIDLYHGGNLGNWANPNLVVDIVNDRPVNQISIRKLPQYHVYYIDLSDVQNRYRVMDSLDRQFTAILNRQDSAFVYMSNGNRPTIAKRSSELPAVVEMMYQVTAGIPNAQEEKTTLKENINPDDMIPGRRQLVLHYVMSNSLYLRSRQVLIGELVEELGLDRDQIMIRIYSEGKILGSSRLDKTRFPNVQYIDLSE